MQKQEEYEELVLMLSWAVAMVFAALAWFFGGGWFTRAVLPIIVLIVSFIIGIAILFVVDNHKKEN